MLPLYVSCRAGRGDGDEEECDVDSQGFLNGHDPLPGRLSRVIVAGASGAGKTTLAAHIGVRLGLPHTEIDALFHGPGWTPRSEFVADVQRLAAGERWVTEWQYALVRPLLAERADLLVWLDLPLPVVMRQVIWRTVRRRLLREELWNGNREPPFRTIVADPEHIVRWAWTGHAKIEAKVLDLHEHRPDLPVVRLRSRAEVRRWCAGLLAAAESSA